MVPELRIGTGPSRCLNGTFSLPHCTEASISSCSTIAVCVTWCLSLRARTGARIFGGFSSVQGMPATLCRAQSVFHVKHRHGGVRSGTIPAPWSMININPGTHGARSRIGLSPGTPGAQWESNQSPPDSTGPKRPYMDPIRANRGTHRATSAPVPAPTMGNRRNIRVPADGVGFRH